MTDRRRPEAVDAAELERLRAWLPPTSTDKNVANVGFANRGAVDLHLSSTSPAINAGDPGTYPAADIDGQARPLGGTPDAGADERQ